MSEHTEPATKRQTWYIFTLTGEDVRSKNLSKDEASAEIARLLAEKNKPAVSKPSKGYAKLLAEATKAASVAGAEWLKDRKPLFHIVDELDPSKKYPPMLDVCGIVYLRFADKRASFYKWYAKKYYRSDKKTTGHALWIRHKYAARQEQGLLEACARAALKVLEDGGVTGIELYSRID